MYEHLPVLVIIVPLITALLIPLLARRSGNLAWIMATGALSVSAICAIQLLVQAHTEGAVVYRMGGWAAPTGIEYVVDRLNGIVLTMVAIMGAVAAFWMRSSLPRELHEGRVPSYYAVFLLCATGLMGITITGDIFNLYVFLEISSITMYVLIAMGRRRQALYAGYSYLIVGSVGATFILLGIGHLYMATGSLSMADLAVRVPQQLDSSVIRTSFAFFAVGLAIKMALFPLHGWLPSAYTEAPAAASLFIASTSTKVSAYALYRVTFGIFGVSFLSDVLPVLRNGLLLTAASAIVLGPLLAVRQSDLKRLLAYSSVGQVGYLVLGLALLDEPGLTGGIVHFWNHAAAKGALFCVAGALVYHTGSARVDDLAGLARKAPWTAVTVTIAGLSMVGVPLTGGFVSKLYLGQGALIAGRPVLVVVLLASSLFTAIYVWRILSLVWFTSDETEAKVTSEVPWGMRLSALGLALACVVLGCTQFAGDLARSAAEALLR